MFPEVYALERFFFPCRTSIIGTGTYYMRAPDYDVKARVRNHSLTEGLHEYIMLENSTQGDIVACLILGSQ